MMISDSGLLFWATLSIDLHGSTHTLSGEHREAYRATDKVTVDKRSVWAMRVGGGTAWLYFYTADEAAMLSEGILRHDSTCISSGGGVCACAARSCFEARLVPLCRTRTASHRPSLGAPNPPQVDGEQPPKFF